MTQAQFRDTNEVGFEVSSALEAFRLVKLTSTSMTVEYAGAGDEPIGVTKYVALNDGNRVAVSLLNKAGTVKCVANGAITINTSVYAQADGKVGSTVTGRKIGTALSSASADGNIVEVMLQPVADYDDETARIKLFDDFFGLESDTISPWEVTATDSGTTAIADEAGSALTIQPSDGTVADNDEIYVASRSEAFKFLDDKPLYLKARVKLTEANTDDANMVIGFMDAVAANSIVDDGAGPKASYSGAVFYKVDGSNALAAEVSIGSTQTAVSLTATTVTSGTYFVYEIEVIPTAANTATINFYVDGTLIGTASSFDYTSATDMQAVIGLKNGGANNEQIDIDYILVSQVR